MNHSDIIKSVSDHGTSEFISLDPSELENILKDAENVIGVIKSGKVLNTMSFSSDDVFIFLFSQIHIRDKRDLIIFSFTSGMKRLETSQDFEKDFLLLTLIIQRFCVYRMHTFSLVSLKKTMPISCRDKVNSFVSPDIPCFCSD